MFRQLLTFSGNFVILRLLHHITKHSILLFYSVLRSRPTPSRASSTSPSSCPAWPSAGLPPRRPAPTWSGIRTKAGEALALAFLIRATHFRCEVRRIQVSRHTSGRPFWCGCWAAPSAARPLQVSGFVSYRCLPPVLALLYPPPAIHLFPYSANSPLLSICVHSQSYIHGSKPHLGACSTLQSATLLVFLPMSKTLVSSRCMNGPLHSL